MITTGVRARPYPRHHRPTPRTQVDPAVVAAILTSRDRWLLRMLLEHRVLTSHQITALAFTNHRRANRRLLALHEHGLIDRFQRYLPAGTAPAHYVLDTTGAAVLAAEHGLDPGALGYRHDRALAVAHSLTLAHTVGVNTLLAALVQHARTTNDGSRLEAWWSESRCARLWGDVVRPDAYARWHTPTSRLEFFLEYDTGTETLHQLASKIDRYATLAATTAITTPVLVWLPTPRRETTARAALSAACRALNHPDRVPVATATPTATATQERPNPADRCWLPLTAAGAVDGRVTLAALATCWPHLSQPTPTTDPAPASPAPVRHLAAPNPMPPASPQPR